MSVLKERTVLLSIVCVIGVKRKHVQWVDTGPNTGISWADHWVVMGSKKIFNNRPQSPILRTMLQEASNQLSPNIVDHVLVARQHQISLLRNFNLTII